VSLQIIKKALIGSFQSVLATAEEVLSHVEKRKEEEAKEENIIKHKRRNHCDQRIRKRN
jgi:hypothetical protein